MDNMSLSCCIGILFVTLQYKLSFLKVERLCHDNLQLKYNRSGRFTFLIGLQQPIENHFQNYFRDPKLHCHHDSLSIQQDLWPETTVYIHWYKWKSSRYKSHDGKLPSAKSPQQQAFTVGNMTYIDRLFPPITVCCLKVHYQRCFNDRFLPISTDLLRCYWSKGLHC